MAKFSFDASQVEPQAPNGPIPAGTYLAHIIESDLRQFKSGNGTGLALTFVVIDGEYKSRRVWTNLNIQHTNPDAQRIGQQQLSSLCRALNALRITRTEELHFKPVKIRVKIRVDDNYGDKNEIAGFEAASGPGIPTAPDAPAVARAAKRPWE